MAPCRFEHESLVKNSPRFDRAAALLELIPKADARAGSRAMRASQDGMAAGCDGNTRGDLLVYQWLQISFDIWELLVDDDDDEMPTRVATAFSEADVGKTIEIYNDKVMVDGVERPVPVVT